MKKTRQIIQRIVSLLFVVIIMLTSVPTFSAYAATPSYPAISALQLSRVNQPQEDKGGHCYWASMATVQGYCLCSFSYGGVTTSYRKAGTDYCYTKKTDAISKYLNAKFSGYACDNCSKMPVKMTLIKSNLGNNEATYKKIYDQLKQRKPVIVYAGRKGNNHASIVIAYNGSSSKLEASGFTVMEVKKWSNSLWYNNASSFLKYANNPQKQTKSKESCYVTLSSWLSNIGSILHICYPTAIEYKVTYNGNGGTVQPTSKTYKSGSTFGTMPVPTKKGSLFSGWYSSASGGKRIDQTAYVDSNQTLFAHWTSDVTAKNVTATGSNIAVSSLIVIKSGDTVLKNGIDYTLKPATVKASGKYDITITGKGDYKGSIVKTICVKPKTPGSVTLKKVFGVNRISVTYGKVADCTGYEVQISKNSDFKNAYTVIEPKNKNSMSFAQVKFGNGKTETVKAGVTYYVRVRAYKTVDYKKTCVDLYSSWSASKKIKY